MDYFIHINEFQGNLSLFIYSNESFYESSASELCGSWMNMNYIIMEDVIQMIKIIQSIGLTEERINCIVCNSRERNKFMALFDTQNVGNYIYI